MLLVDLIIIGYFKYAWMNRKAPAPAASRTSGRGARCV